MSVDTVTTCATTRRSCRTKGKSKRSKSKKDPTSPSDVKIPHIHIDDDLGFDRLEVCDIPEDMLFPGEYNVYLQDKLKSIYEENKQLSVLVKARDDEITEMKEKLLAFESQVDGNNSKVSAHFSGPDSFLHADLAACRVMELTKQVCELTVQLEEQRGHCALAETKLLSVIESQEEREPLSSEILAKKDLEIKTLSDKLHATNSKVFEGRNKIQHLQQDLKNAQKVLLHEVGDGVSIPDLISSGGSSGWKGRAQQIQILQQRVTELMERLRKHCDSRNLGDTSSYYHGEGPNKTKERKASLEVAQQETRIAQQHLSESIRKLDAGRARIKVLESESTSLRARIHLLTEKGDRDEEVIQKLQAQVRQLESSLQLSKDDARSEIKKSEKYYQQLLDDLRLEKQRSMQLLSSLEEKEKQAKRLEDMLLDLKDKEIDSLKKDSRCDGRKVDDCSLDYSAPPVETPIKNNPKVLAAEVECKKLLEVVGTVNRRLNDARHECDKHKSALRLERQRLARLEAKQARQEMERGGSFLMSKRQFASSAKNASAAALPEINIQLKEEMENKVELLQEEVLTLQTRLSCIEQEKEDDLRAFAAILSGSSQQNISNSNLRPNSFMKNEAAKTSPP